MGELGVWLRDGKVTNYRDETVFPNPEEAEPLAKGTGGFSSTVPYGSMPH
jgi:hypothetical protein